MATGSTRRSFFTWLTALFGTVAAALVAIPFVGYLMGALRKPKIDWIPLGPLADFPAGQTRLAPFSNPISLQWDGMTAKTGVYVRSLGNNDFQVFAMNCTHLGCGVSWFPASGLFMCPCHGGVYYENGERASGPPPEGLYHCPWRIVNGTLEVQAPHLPTLQDKLTQRRCNQQPPNA